MENYCMIGKLFGYICVISCFFGCLTGNMSNVSSAIFEGVSSAVELTLGLIGVMGLWGGIMNVAQTVGVTDSIASIFAPLIKVLFPDAYKKKNGINEIAAVITANLIGLGNAVTPLALRVMKKLQENNTEKERASDDMVMFTVLGTVPLNIFPTTLIAIRQISGSVNAFDVIVPIILCSLFCNVFAVTVVMCIGRTRGKN